MPTYHVLRPHTKKGRKKGSLMQRVQRVERTLRSGREHKVARISGEKISHMKSPLVIL